MQWPWPPWPSLISRPGIVKESHLTANICFKFICDRVLIYFWIRYALPNETFQCQTRFSSTEFTWIWQWKCQCQPSWNIAIWSITHAAACVSSDAAFYMFCQKFQKFASGLRQDKESKRRAQARWKMNAKMPKLPNRKKKKYEWTFSTVWIN